MCTMWILLKKHQIITDKPKNIRNNMAQKTLLEQSSEQKDFETLIAQAKEVVAKLNANDIGLKDSLLLFKEGTEILKQAQDMLESAKLEFEEITQKMKS